jgi:protocatechuate 3,4-dioxygenase beta subunit
MTRRRMLVYGLGLPVIAFWASRSASACSERNPTPAETEGPYFKAGSPERASLLESGITGRKLVLTGSVSTTSCQPVPRALLDFWQANADGQYDNAGFRLRGHQFTDAEGRYRLETIFPGVYPGRTEHIHVKLTVPGKPTLTTQLYFPGVSLNARDPLFDVGLVVSVVRDADPMLATFDFIASS